MEAQNEHDVRVPFEMHAYDAIFTTVKVLQSQQFDRIHRVAVELLAYTKKGSLLPLELQERIRELKNVTAKMSGKLESYRRVLNELIENDQDMALMNLTVLRDNPTLYRSPLSPEVLAAHEEVEEMLQSYVMDFNSLYGKLDSLRSQIQTSQDLVLLRLDTSRNELLVANTAFAILASCVGLGSYIAGLYGMNLDNTVTIQPIYGVFSVVWAGATFCMIALFVAIY
eukprot:gene4810-6123_t